MKVADICTREVGIVTDRDLVIGALARRPVAARIPEYSFE